MKVSCFIIAILLATGLAPAAVWREAHKRLERPPSRILTTAYQAHSLTLAEAARHYPVHLKGVVTYYDPYIDPRRPALFVHDSSGAIFIALAGLPKSDVRPGMIVEVTGESATGDFAPIVDKGEVRVTGASHVPLEAPLASFSQLVTGEYDGQWVRVEGIVHAVRDLGRNIELRIAMSGGALTAATPKQPGENYSALVDAIVRVRANAAPVFNKKLQMTGVRLLFPSLGEVTIEESAVRDPFTLPILPIRNLLTYVPGAAFRRRVHIRGRVSLHWPGRLLCIQDETQGLCVRTAESGNLAPGEIADVAGFPDVDGFSPTLTDATFRSRGSRRNITALPVTAEQAFLGDHDAELVRIEGKLIGEDRAAKDPTFILSAGKYLFPIVLDRSLAGAVQGWREGSVLSVTGICSVQTDAAEVIRAGFATPASFRILLRSPADTAIVRSASWWTAAHLLMALAIAFATALGTLAWVAALRHRITEQSALIRKQNATLIGLSFQDGLTGIANRRKFDETLATELRLALESSKPISLLMLDIDHFKALNDEFGHQRGDECLVRVAEALASCSLRASDLVARYGGEEFAVIMPDCDENRAADAAERMRTAVLDLSIAHPGSSCSRSVSVSVGAATLRPVSNAAAAAALIGMADGALYRSKQLGRNRSTLSAESYPPPSPAHETPRERPMKAHTLRS
ncbi:MAG TPA: diguanylate cyclase [Bryobacteraceae bacterium]|nr:diguanylate cyclase [Bryobacteraceae bacterium]